MLKTLDKDIEKVAHELNGRERARILLKDRHEKEQWRQDGFLGVYQRSLLLQMREPMVRKEYGQYAQLYANTPFLFSVVTDPYWEFLFYNEILFGCGLYLSMLSAEHIRTFLTIEKLCSEERIVIRNGKNVRIVDSPIVKLRQGVEKAHKSACKFLAAQELVKKVTEKLGFCPITGKEFDGTLCNRLSVIMESIDDHNSFMNHFGQDFGFGVADYLIPAPSVDSEYHDCWMAALKLT